MDQATAALTGALIGALAGVSGAIGLEAYKRHRDRRGTASALAGEIASILYLVQRRNYVQIFTQILARMDTGSDIPIPRIVGPEPGYRDPVMDRHIDRLGLLPNDLPERVVRFYSYLSAIRFDLHRFANSDDYTNDHAAKRQIVGEDLTIWGEAEALGNQLVADLRTVARPLLLWRITTLTLFKR